MIRPLLLTLIILVITAALISSLSYDVGFHEGRIQGYTMGVRSREIPDFSNFRSTTDMVIDDGWVKRP